MVQSDWAPPTHNSGPGTFSFFVFCTCRLESYNSFLCLFSICRAIFMSFSHEFSFVIAGKKKCLFQVFSVFFFLIAKSAIKMHFLYSHFHVGDIEFWVIVAGLKVAGYSCVAIIFVSLLPPYNIIKDHWGHFSNTFLLYC